MTEIYVNKKALEAAEIIGGRYLSSFIESAAALDYDEYASIVAFSGFKRISKESSDDLDKYGVFGGVSSLRTSNQYDEFDNGIMELLLLARYPFLQTTEFLDYQDKENATLASYHRVWALSSLPSGWRARFGLELCEDIRTVLLEAAKREEIEPEIIFDSYIVEQVKEKFGSLRWYDLAPESVSDTLSDIVEMYTSLSASTCCCCGSFTDVLFDKGGYILPECFECRKDADTRRDMNARINKNANVGLATQWVETNGLNNPFYIIPQHVYEMILRKELEKLTVKDKKLFGNIKITQYSVGQEPKQRELTSEYENSGLKVIDLIKQHDKAIDEYPQQAPLTDGELVEMFNEAAAERESRFA